MPEASEIELASTITTALNDAQNSRGEIARLRSALEFVHKWIALRTDRGQEFPSQIVNAVSAALAGNGGEA